MQLNEWFKLRHFMRIQVIRNQICRGVDPLLLRVGNDAIFIHRERRCVATILDDAYHRYKALCHVPVALYMWLSELTAKQLTSQDAAMLGQLRSEMQEHRLRGLDEASRDIADAVCVLVDRVVEVLAVEFDRLTRFEGAVAQPTQHLIVAATEHELDNLDRCVRTWTADFDDETWGRLRVVICANHQARYRQSSKLYFQRLLGERDGLGAKGEHHVLYAENAATEDEAIDLLATHLLDRELGIFFMKSPLALQQDVLGEAARAVLERRFGPDRSG